MNHVMMRLFPATEWRQKAAHNASCGLRGCFRIPDSEPCTGGVHGKAMNPDSSLVHAFQKRQRTGALQDASRDSGTLDERVSVLECGSPLPLFNRHHRSRPQDWDQSVSTESGVLSRATSPEGAAEKRVMQLRSRCDEGFCRSSGAWSFHHHIPQLTQWATLLTPSPGLKRRCCRAAHYFARVGVALFSRVRRPAPLRWLSGIFGLTGRLARPEP
jgi:hypothetical protein